MVKTLLHLRIPGLGRSPGERNGDGSSQESKDCRLMRHENWGKWSVNTSHLRPRCWHEFWTGAVPLLDFQSMSLPIPVEVCVSHSVVSDSLRPHGLYPARLLCPSGKNTRVSSHFLLQGIFLNQGSNPGFPHCGQFLYCLSHQGSPKRKC